MKLITSLPSVKALSVVMVFLSLVVNARAQQMQDMPYDLHFIDMMIMHHQEAAEMADLAKTKSANPKVKAFATKTAADQQKDIGTLQAHRNHWYAGKPIMDPATMESTMKSMHPGMNMNMEETRRSLRAATGGAFDRLFLDTMIHHHMMGVDMAKEATNKAEHSELKDFARTAVTKQTAEIAEMNRLKGAPATSTKTRAKTTAKPKPKTTSAHKH